jgi:hypothetical protein
MAQIASTVTPYSPGRKPYMYTCLLRRAPTVPNVQQSQFRRRWSERQSVDSDHGFICCCRHFKQRVRETAGAASAAQVHNIRKWLVCMEIHHGLTDAEVGVDWGPVELWCLRR